MKKAFTDLEQSKKLAEILPLESADMWYAERYSGQINDNGEYIVAEKPVYYLSLVKPSDTNYSQDVIRDIHCWSLTALLDNIPQVKLDSSKQYDKKLWRCCTYFASDWHNSDWCDNPIDACVNIILTLHEHKFLSNK